MADYWDFITKKVGTKFGMAASSSDESSTAPKDFHLSSSIDSASRLSPNHRRCPLCSGFRKTFYCKECINSGNFYSSKLHSERFADKQLRSLELKTSRKNVEEACNVVLKKKLKVDGLQSDIRQSKTKIIHLKLALEQRKEKNQSTVEKLKHLRENNSKLRISLPKYEERVERLANFVAEKRETIGGKRITMGELQNELRNLRKKRIKSLIEDIFPIRRVEAKSELESSESDMVSALAEASRTMYIRDRWVTDNSGELQYSIVAPTLPGSGNYNDYNDWVAQYNAIAKEKSDIEAENTVQQIKDAAAASAANSNLAVEHNPAYRISAALTYTAQLVQVMAFYLDVRLPYKMQYSDFCSSVMKEEQFSRRVARLNANILHLCFTQNTDPKSLKPAETLHNILQLLDENISDLGRQGPMELDSKMTTSLEKQLGSNLETATDSDSEEGDSLPNEWEAVPHVQLPEAAAGPLNLQSSHTITQQQATSVAGGLLSSAAAGITSFFKGWTGR